MPNMARGVEALCGLALNRVGAPALAAESWRGGVLCVSKWQKGLKV